MQAFFFLAGVLLLAPGAARGTVHNQFCFQGTCTIQNPVVTNVYWDSSLAQWDKDVAATTPDMAHQHIDDLTLALVHSDYFNRLGQYSVNTPTLGVSIATGPCMAAPNNISAAINDLPTLTSCLFLYHPNLNSGNTILNIFLPPSVGTSSGWCGNGGNTTAQHDEYGTPIEITMLPTNSACNGSLSALMYSMAHELVEAATDPNPKSPTGWKTQLGNGLEIGDVCQPPNSFFLASNFLFAQVTAYWSNNDNGCVYGWSSPPISASGSACGTGQKMTLTLKGPFGGPPWDLAAHQFGFNTLYLNAQIQHAGKTWEAGNFEGLPNNASLNQGKPDQVYFLSLNWTPGTITVGGFDNGYGQTLATGAVAKVSPGDKINVQLADSSNGVFATVPITAPSPSQIINLAVTPEGGDPYVIVNKQAGVSGMVADPGGCAVQEQTVDLSASQGVLSTTREADQDDGSFGSGYTAPGLAGTYQVTSKLEANPSVTASVDVPVHPLLNAINPSIGPVAGGQNVTLSGDGFVNPSGTAVFFNSSTAQVQSETLQSIQAVTPPSPLGGFGDGMVGVSANSLLTLNSNMVAYQYVYPGRPYFSFQDIGCQGSEYGMVVTVYDNNANPIIVPIALTAHKGGLMLIGNLWIGATTYKGQAQSGQRYIVKVSGPSTSFTAANLSLYAVAVLGQKDPYSSTASPIGEGIYGCVPVHLLLPKELNQYLSNGSDLPPQPMRGMSVPKGRVPQAGPLVAWSNDPNPSKATGYVTGPAGSAGRIHVRTVGWEKFRTLMQPPMYLRSGGAPAGTAPAGQTIPVPQVQFSGPAFSVFLTGQAEGEVAALGSELQLSFGTSGGGGAQAFRIVHLITREGQPTWVEDAPEQSHAEGRGVARALTESGIYALVEIVGMTSEPALQPSAQPAPPLQPPAAPQPAPANSTILVPDNAFPGGVLTGLVLGPDDQPVPNTPVNIAGGVPITLTGVVIGEEQPPNQPQPPAHPPQPCPPDSAGNLPPGCAPPTVNQPSDCAAVLKQFARTLAGQAGPQPGTTLPSPTAGATPTTVEAGGGPHVVTDANGRFAMCIPVDAPKVDVTLPGGSPTTVKPVAGRSTLPNLPPSFLQPSQRVSLIGVLRNLTANQGGQTWQVPAVYAWSPNGQQTITTFQTPRTLQPGPVSLSYTGGDGQPHQVQGNVFRIVSATLDRSRLHSDQGATFEYVVQFGGQTGQNLCVEMQVGGPVVLVQAPPEVIAVDANGMGRFSGRIRATQVAPGAAVPFELTPNIHLCGQ